MMTAFGRQWTVDGGRCIRLALLFLFCLLSTVHRPPEARADCALPSDGLVGHWKLDETSGTNADNATGGNDGSMLGGLDAANDAFPGTVNGALDFDGNDYISVNSEAALAMPGSYTLSVWAFPHAISGSSGYQTLIGKGNTSNYNVQFEDDEITAGFEGTGTCSGGCWFTTSGLNLTPDNWYHIVSVFDDEGNRMKTYLNGASVLDVALAESHTVNAEAVNIGRTWTWGEYFDGLLDDARIYNRALSADEIKALYFQRSTAAAPAGYMTYDTRHSRMMYCNGTNWVHAGIGSYNPNAANFDGANDYLARGAALTGAANTKQVTGSAWLRFTAVPATDHSRIVINTSGRFSFDYDNTADRFGVLLRNSSGTIIGQFTCGGAAPVAGAWYHVLFSVDLADANKRHCYVNGASGYNHTTYTNDTIDVTTPTDWRVGATVDGPATFKWPGDIADLWIDFGAYMDLSQAANREKFRSPNGMPMYLGMDGSIPTGGKPDIYLSGDTVTFASNRGAGGGFTVNGALTTAASQPGDTLLAAAGGVTSGLLYHWKLDETGGASIAAAAGGVNGTWSDGTGNDVAQEAVTGKIGGGLVFDGTDDRISTGTLGTFGADLDAGTWTFSMWVKAANSAPGSALGAFNASGTAFSIWINQDHNDVNTQGSLSVYSRGAGGNTDELRGGVTVNTGLSDGNWRHLAVTYNATGNTLGFYVDGVQYATGYTDQETPGFTANLAVPLMIGARNMNGTAAAFFNGALDDVRIYNRGLSAAEISYLAKSGNPGEMRYSDDHSVMEYFNGAEWTAMGPVGGTPPSSGLVGHWPMDETSGTNVNDASAGNNDGTWSGEAQVRSASGKIGGALDFDGSDDAVITADTTSHEPSNITISAWVYPHASADSRIVAKHNAAGSANFGYQLRTHDPERVFSCEFGHNSGSKEAGFSTANFTPNNWYHIVCIYDGSIAKIYLNGAFNGMSSGGSAIDYTNVTGLRIGQESDGSTEFDGLIDDVRIYNRVLTEQEISQLYQFGLSNGLGDVSGDCANPTRPEGVMIYNIDHNYMQYCNGERWVAIGR